MLRGEPPGGSRLRKLEEHGGVLLVAAHSSEADRSVQPHRRRVTTTDAQAQGRSSAITGRFDERSQQRSSHAAAPPGGCHGDRQLRDRLADEAMAGRREREAPVPRGSDGPTGYLGDNACVTDAPPANKVSSQALVLVDPLQRRPDGSRRKRREKEHLPQERLIGVRCRPHGVVGLPRWDRSPWHVAGAYLPCRSPSVNWSPVRGRPPGPRVGGSRLAYRVRPAHAMISGPSCRGSSARSRSRRQETNTNRQAVRVLLFDDADRVLLVRFWDGARSWWCTPGGGIEPGESDERAAQRELREELGAVPVELGPLIWTRRHVGVFRGRAFDQSERIYIGRVAAFEPSPSPDGLREHGPEDIRWWTIDELETADDDFAPRRLPELVRQLTQDGPPAPPVDVGV